MQVYASTLTGQSGLLMCAVRAHTQLTDRKWTYYSGPAHTQTHAARCRYAHNPFSQMQKSSKSNKKYVSMQRSARHSDWSPLGKSILRRLWCAGCCLTEISRVFAQPMAYTHQRKHNRALNSENPCDPNNDWAIMIEIHWKLATSQTDSVRWFSAYAPYCRILYCRINSINAIQLVATAAVHRLHLHQMKFCQSSHDSCCCWDSSTDQARFPMLSSHHTQAHKYTTLRDKQSNEWRSSWFVSQFSCHKNIHKQNALVDFSTRWRWRSAHRLTDDDEKVYSALLYWRLWQWTANREWGTYARLCICKNTCVPSIRTSSDDNESPVVFAIHMIFIHHHAERLWQSAERSPSTDAHTQIHANLIVLFLRFWCNQNGDSIIIRSRRSIHLSICGKKYNNFRVDARVRWCTGARRADLGGLYVELNIELMRRLGRVATIFPSPRECESSEPEHAGKIENTEKITRSCRILLITEEHFGRLFRIHVVLGTTFCCDTSIQRRRRWRWLTIWLWLLRVRSHTEVKARFRWGIG